jgi:uncharacterized protein YggE
MNEGLERKFYAIAIIALIALVAVNILLPPRGGTVLLSASTTSADKTISVTGTGVVSARPDEAWFFAAVVTRSLTATQALADNAAAMNQVLDQLNQLGIPKEKIETVSFSLNPVYDYNGKAPVLVGYEVRNAIKVTVSDLNKLGQIIDAVVNAGANEVQGVQFTLSAGRSEELKQQALQLAVADASGKAQALASLLHVTLVGPTSVDISWGYQPIYASVERSTLPAQTPIVPGQLEVTVSVHIVYAFA